MCGSVCVCVCVCRRLALCPPVILLSTWTMEEQLAWPSCTQQCGEEERMMCTAFRWRDGNRKRRTNLLIYFSVYLSSIFICLSSLSILSPPSLGCCQSRCLGPGAASILMVQYWHSCCGKFKRPTCAISPAAGPGSSRGRLL